MASNLLLKYQCQGDAVSVTGGLASICAAYNGHMHLLQMLIDEFKFSPTLVRLTDGLSLLHAACGGKHYETANTLITKYQLVPTAKDLGGHTALHSVCGFLNDSLEKVGDFHFPPDVEVTSFVDWLISLKCDPMDRDKRGRTALHYAALSGQTQVVRLLVKKYKCPVECRDNDGDTPLHKAAARGHTRVVEVLLSELGADVEACNKNNNTALHRAALSVHNNVVALLVDQFGCSPLTKGFMNRTILHHACQGGYVELIEKLINVYHCDPMARDDDGLTPLHIAALVGKEHVVTQLVGKYDCPVECRDNNGHTPLHIAAARGHTHVVEVLLSELGADVEARNKENNTALHVAVQNGHNNAVALLVDQFGCDPHTKGYNNRTLLHQACWGGHSELVEKLIDDYHCDSMARDDNGLTPLHIAAWAGKEHVVRQLVSKYDCPVECTDNNDRTPLHKAAEGGHPHVVEVLLSELGADVEARDKQNDTALHLAALNGQSNVVALLVDQFGCSPDTKGYNSRTVLHHACLGGHLELVEKLIDSYHCDSMAKDDGGLTPLHITALVGKKSILSVKQSITTTLLLKYKCSPHIFDHEGNTLLDLFVSRGNIESVKLLVDITGAFSSIKNNQSRAPIDWDPIQLLLLPDVKMCVEYLSQHAVGEYRHAPHKLLVFDKDIVSSLNTYSTYSLLSSTSTQSCGICHMDSVDNDIWVCHVPPDTQNTPVLQSLTSGPMVMAVITVDFTMPTERALCKVFSQVSLSKQLAFQNDSKTLKILLTGVSPYNKQSQFKTICEMVITNVQNDSIQFSQQILVCQDGEYQQQLYPVLSQFISTSVGTVPNPEVLEITHGSICLLK